MAQERKERFEQKEEEAEIPSGYLSEQEYPLTTENAIRPTPVEDWTVIPLRPVKKQANKSMSVKSKSLEKRLTRKARKTAKKEYQANIRGKLLQNKYRWTRGESTLLDDSYVEKLEHGMATFFRPGYEAYWNGGDAASEEDIIDTIRTLFKKYKLNVSGGFVLKNTGLSVENMSKPSVDIDIYMSHSTPVSHPDFYETMAKLFHCDVKETPKGPKYDINKFISVGRGFKHSFFKKNGIHSVFKHKRNIDGQYAEMDLVRPVKGINPITIIKNFDLTVCMNWYDGTSIHVMDMDGIMKKGVGYLNYSYVPLLLGITNNQGASHEKNPVTRDRILKYLLRGYRIQYMDPRTGEMTEIQVKDLRNSVSRLPRNKQEAVRSAYHLSNSYESKNQ